MVDAGDHSDNEQFLSNLKAFVDQEKIQISKILITHAHHDHFGGLRSVLNMLAPQNPTCYKMLTDNKHERDIFERFPELKS